jgi:hypothetical protein
MIADQNGSEATEVIRLFPTFVWSNGLRPPRTSRSTPLSWACSGI